MRKASLFRLDCLWQSFVNPRGPISSQCHDLSKWAAQSSWVPCHSPKLLTHRSPFMASAAGHVSALTPAQEGCKQLAPSRSSCAGPSLSPVLPRSPGQLGLPTPCQAQQANKSSLIATVQANLVRCDWRRPGDALWSTQQSWCCAKEASVGRQVMTSPAITTWDACLHPV